jgi:hypothetical protein
MATILVASRSAASGLSSATKREFPATGLGPAQTKQFLLAQRLVIVLFAACDLAIRLTNLG